MENVIKKYEGTYEEFRDRLGSELQREAESFVRIGYLLKVARDSDVLAASGYKSVADFAAAEYKLTKDVVSRYMAINDRYSEGGYSDVLQEQYRVYGYTKLAEMLTLPPEIADAVPPEATRAEIQDLKREIREENQESPMEVMMEAGQDDADMPLLYRMLKEYYHGKPAEYSRMHEAVWLWKMQAGKAEDIGSKHLQSAAQDILAPSGNIVMLSRVAGVGRVMLVVRDSGLPELRSVRSGEQQAETWLHVWETLGTLVSGNRESVEDAWEFLYGEKYPLAEAVRDEKTEQKDRVIRTSGGPGTAPKAPDRSVSAPGKGSKKAAPAAQGNVPERGKSVPGPTGNVTEPGKSVQKQAENAHKPAESAQKPAENAQKAAESVQEPAENAQEPDQDTAAAGQQEEPDGDLRVLEAKRLAHVVLDSLDREKFMSARRAARALIEKIAEICDSMADADIDGQMSIGDLEGMQEESE